MKSKFIVLIFISFVFKFSYSQTTVKIYDSSLGGKKQFTEALEKAKKENKHVLMQIGGNWCTWCIKLDGYIKENSQLDSIIKADYIRIKVNYSKENKNLELMKMLQKPQRFGFPVLVITDENGVRLHTQNTWYLEDGKDSYDLKKVKSFLLNWNKKALSD